MCASSDQDQRRHCQRIQCQWTEICGYLEAGLLFFSACFELLWHSVLFAQFPGVLAYCMSKSAIDQFTRCVALGKSFLSHYCISSSKSSQYKWHKMNVFQNWQVNKSEWTLYGECLNLFSHWPLSYFINSYINYGLNKTFEITCFCWCWCIMVFNFLLLLCLFSPGVIITDVHKRAGLDEDQYTQVTHHVNTVWQDTFKHTILSDVLFMRVWLGLYVSACQIKRHAN